MAYVQMSNKFLQKKFKVKMSFATFSSRFFLSFCFVILFNLGHNAKVAHIYLHIYNY